MASILISGKRVIYCKNRVKSRGYGRPKTHSPFPNNSFISKDLTPLFSDTNNFKSSSSFVFNNFQKSPSIYKKINNFSKSNKMYQYNQSFIKNENKLRNYYTQNTPNSFDMESSYKLTFYHPEKSNEHSPLISKLDNFTNNVFPFL